MIEIKEIAHFSGNIRYVAWFYGNKITFKGEVCNTPENAKMSLVKFIIERGV
jgi:hypothetical protein